MPKPPQNTSHLFRILHWVLAACAGILVLSGLGISAASRTLTFLWPQVYPVWLPGGRLPLWHLAAAPLFATSWAIAVAEYVRGSWYGRGSPSRRIANLPLLIAAGLSILSASALICPDVPETFSRAARILHAGSGLVLVPLSLLLHIGITISRGLGRLIAAFHPGREVRWLAIALWLPVAIAFESYILNEFPVRFAWRELVVKRAAGKIGEAGRLPWQGAPPLEIALANGAGFDGGRTRVTLRAFHDGEEIVVLAEWRDPTEDRRYMPWRRTEDGWEHLMTREDDESVHYEDKFSLIFPDRGDVLFRAFGCAAQCHLGGGRAYGYKISPSIVDVWHWKATRSDPVGQADDQYWYLADPANEDVGRFGDPSQGGGYKKNFARGGTAPLRLPEGPDAIQQGGLLTDRSAEYSVERAGQIAPGTEIPGITIAPFAGDRGDVRSISRHEHGRWFVFLRRRLAASGPYDREFRPGGRYEFGCAAFDCTSKRHAYNYQVYRLVLEE